MKILSFLLFLFTVSTSLSAETLTINDPNDGWLNLRSGPGTSYRIIQRMDNGLRVEELERQGNWSNVVLPSGVVGWSYRRFMKSASAAPSQPAPDSWFYADGEAVWDLTQNGRLLAQVFLGRDFDVGGFYYGFSRVSDDPMIHFMGVSVAHSDGRVVELEANGCYGRKCITTQKRGNGNDISQVRIPIARHDEASILREMKSGEDITFRYQTVASASENKFKRMKLGLKGSRRALDQLQSATPGQDLVAQPKTQDPIKPPTTVTTVQAPKITPSGSGKSFLVNETKDGDRFCDAAELSEYPPQINAPEMERILYGTQHDAHTKKYVRPVSVDFVGRGTTVWEGFPAGSDGIAFYANGAVLSRGHVIRNGKIFQEKKWQGSWQQDPKLGMRMALKSVNKLSWGHEYLECSHGLLTASDFSVGNRLTTDKNGKSVMKKANWRGCTLLMHCKRWTDEHPERKAMSMSSLLVEWSTGQIPLEQWRWVEY